jgi:KUP system potassium uptake protein
LIELTISRPQSKRENRALTTYTTASVNQTLSDRVSFFRRRFVRNALLVLALFGTGLTMADGLLTPAVSVTSAVGGIAVPFPSVSNKVVGISCALLVLLWLLQTAGTRRIGSLFAPIMVGWFALNLVTGAINVSHYPGIFRGKSLLCSSSSRIDYRFSHFRSLSAFDPSRAVLLFVRTKNYDLLSGVILALTGAEALFAK